MAGAGQVLSSEEPLSEAIRFANFAGGTVRIDGEQVREVVLELPWKVVVVLRSGVRGVVEAKNYSKPIPKEWVMKTHSVAKDIGAQEVYVVSVSGFTEDAVKGLLLVVGEDFVELLSISSVTKEEAELLDVLGGSDEPMSVGDLEDELGWSRQKISRVLSKLVESGLVEYEEEEDINTGRTVKLYYSIVPSVDELKETSNTLSQPLVDGEPREAHAVEPKIPLSNIVSVVTSLYDMKIVGKRLVYLPVYKVKFVSTEDNSYRYMYFLACLDPPPPIEGIEVE